MGKTPIVVNDCPGFFVNHTVPLLRWFQSQLLRDSADFPQSRQSDGKTVRLADGAGVSAGWLALIPRITRKRLWRRKLPSACRKDYRDAIDALFDANRFGQKTVWASGAIKKT